jgi:2'-5' RNA ligase
MSRTFMPHTYLAYLCSVQFVYERVSKIVRAHQEVREWQLVQLSAQSAIVFQSSESGK